MNSARFLMITAVLLRGCVTETPTDLLVDYEEVDAAAMAQRLATRT